jgi:hypothetical protein
MKHRTLASEPEFALGWRAVWRLWTADLWPAIAWGVSIALFAMLFLFGANKLALYNNLPEVKARLAEAFAQADLTDANYAHGNSIIGSHQYNDCLILGMALDQPGGLRQELSISPLIPGIARRDSNGNFPDYDAPCLALHKLVKGEADVVSSTYYHRYLHGQVVLTRLLLPSLGVSGMRAIYKSLLSLLLLGGLSLALMRLVQRRSTVYVGFVVAFACFARLFGLGEFGQSLGHAPSDMLLVAYLLFACVSAESGPSIKTMLVAAAAFGALTMILELLTGGLPLGVAMIVGTSAMMLPRTASAQLPIKAMLSSLTAFLAAAITCVVCKLAASVTVFGSSVLYDYGRQLGTRMALRKADNLPTSPALFLQKLVGGLSSLAEYSHVLVAGTILIAIIAGIWGLHSVRRASPWPAERTRATLLALSTLPIALWFPLFWQHTIQHAWFMDRILVWIIVAGFWLFSEGLAVTAPQLNPGPSKNAP